MTEVGTGHPTIDTALGGLITGDNVVWVTDDDGTYGALCQGFARAATARGQRVLHVTFGSDPFELPGAPDRLDASGRSTFARAAALGDELDRRWRNDRPDCVVVDDLGQLLRRWGPEATLAFFTRACPSMLQAGITAYWSVGSSLGRSALDTIRQVTQCYIDVRDGRLRVLKAEGRPAHQHGASFRLRVDGDDVIATSTPGGGRLARGLVTLRQELGMTQQELAAIAGVTASAISQAETGHRGLSVDTLVHLSDQLGVSLDRIVNTVTTPTYQLARHDRTRRAADGSAALSSDRTIGARVFLVDLAGGEKSAPDRLHPGVEVIAALRGLVQVDLGHDRPVLRSGDALVVDNGQVAGWQNLRPEPAAFFRILRD